MELFKHQENILNLLTQNKGFAIYAEQGTGKTIPTLIHLTNLFMAGKIKDALVVAPLSALGSWVSDIEKLPKFRQRLCENITFINYDKLSRKGSKAREDLTKYWGAIVLDEAHCIKERNSNRTKFLMALSKYSDYRYVLTGTPLANGHLENFYTLCNFIEPNTFPSWKEFAARYLIQIRLPGTFVDIIKGYRNQDELLQIVARNSIRIYKKDCIDLPDKLDDSVIYLECKEPKMYKDAINNFIEELDIIIDRPLTRIIKIRQLVSGHIKDEQGLTNVVKTDKVKAMLELIESINDKTIIFAEFKESINQIKKALDKEKIKYIVLDGDQKDKNIWKQFQDKDDIQVIVCQYASANAGINLYKSSHTIFYEPNLSTTVISQAKDRSHRIGVKNACNYYWLITRDTLEEDIYKTLVKNEDFNQEVLLDIMKRKRK